MLDPGRTTAMEVLGLGTLLHSGPGLYLRGSALAGLFNPDLFGVVVVVVVVETGLSLDVSLNLALSSLDSLLLLLLFVFSGSLLTCAFAPSGFDPVFLVELFLQFSREILFHFSRQWNLILTLTLFDLQFSAQFSTGVISAPVVTQF